MTTSTHITVADGKYTLILEPSNLRALRYGEPWRSLIGDGFVMALGYEIEDLREIIRDLTQAIEPLKVRGMPITQLDTKLRKAMDRARTATA
jgi:hypothetical protein